MTVEFDGIHLRTGNSRGSDFILRLLKEGGTVLLITYKGLLTFWLAMTSF